MKWRTARRALLRECCLAKALWSTLFTEADERLSASTGSSAHRDLLKALTRLDCSGVLLPDLFNVFGGSVCAEPPELADSRWRVSVHRLHPSTFNWRTDSTIAIKSFHTRNPRYVIPASYRCRDREVLVRLTIWFQFGLFCRCLVRS